jgi:hypothetical protein
VRLRLVIVGLVAIVGWLGFSPGSAWGQQKPSVLAHMVGKWAVTERMWSGPGATPIALPDATAERRIVGDYLVEETMVAVSGTKSSFTRIADLNFNVVTHQFEYFSWDSRAPQMMSEKSRGDTALAGGSDQRAVTLYGGTFVAPQWGKLRNASFKYRLVLGRIEHSRQIVQLYFTPQFGSSTTEFLAFEYVYVKNSRGE